MTKHILLLITVLINISLLRASEFNSSPDALDCSKQVWIAAEVITASMTALAGCATMLKLAANSHGRNWHQLTWDMINGCDVICAEGVEILCGDRRPRPLRMD